jgi:hypothetical protein
MIAFVGAVRLRLDGCLATPDSEFEWANYVIDGGLIKTL